MCFLNTLHSIPLAVITVREINWCCCRSDLSWIFIFCAVALLLLSVFIAVSCVLLIVIANIGSTSGSVYTQVHFRTIFSHIFLYLWRNSWDFICHNAQELSEGLHLAAFAQLFSQYRKSHHIPEFNSPHSSTFLNSTVPIIFVSHQGMYSRTGCKSFCLPQTQMMGRTLMKEHVMIERRTSFTVNCHFLQSYTSSKT